MKRTHEGSNMVQTNAGVPLKPNPFPWEPYKPSRPSSNAEGKFAKVVPWFSKGEWTDTFHKLYSPDTDDQQMAVDRIDLWKAKVPQLAMGIEVSASLTRAQLFDLRTRECGNYPSEVALIYGTALVRFIDMTCDSLKVADVNQTTRTVAKNLEIPEWIVDVRHAVVHQKMPVLGLLRASCCYALQWLRSNFWEVEKEASKDWESLGNPEGCQEEAENQIRSYLTLFQQLQYELLYGKNADKDKTKENLMTTQRTLRRLLFDDANLFARVLAEQGFLVSRYDHLDALLKEEWDDRSFLDGQRVTLPHSLEAFWGPVVKLFSQGRSLQGLLECLLSPVSEEELFVRVSMSWALRLLTSVAQRDKNIFGKSRPLLDWHSLLVSAMKSPNRYSPLVISKIIEEIPMKSSVRENLMALVAIKMGCVPAPDSSITSKKRKKLFTAKDLAKRVKDLNDEPVVKGPWKLASADIPWGKYPIGTCPGYSKKEAVEDSVKLSKSQGEEIEQAQVQKRLKEDMKGTTMVEDEVFKDENEVEENRISSQDLIFF